MTDQKIKELETKKVKETKETEKKPAAKKKTAAKSSAKSATAKTKTSGKKAAPKKDAAPQKPPLSGLLNSKPWQKKIQAFSLIRKSRIACRIQIPFPLMKWMKFIQNWQKRISKLLMTMPKRKNRKNMDDEELTIEESELSNLSVPEGVIVDDPVRMYLKEIGRVPPAFRK